MKREPKRPRPTNYRAQGFQSEGLLKNAPGVIGTIALAWKRRKTNKRKTHKTKSSRDCTGIFGGILFMCYFSIIRNDPEKYINKFLTPTQSIKRCFKGLPSRACKFYGGKASCCRMRKGAQRPHGTDRFL